MEMKKNYQNITRHPLAFSYKKKCIFEPKNIIQIDKLFKLQLAIGSVGSQIAAHTLIETGNGPNEPNTINL